MTAVEQELDKAGMLKLFEETPVLDKGELVLSDRPGFGLDFAEPIAPGKSAPPPNSPARTNSSSSFPTDTTPRSRNAAPTFRADSASGSRSPGR